MNILKPNIEPDTVMNILANNKDFSNTYGWLGDNVIGWEQLPTIDNWLATDAHALIDYPGKSYLKILEDSYVYNNGILASGENFKDGFVKGEKYILRIKPYILDTSAPSSAPQPLNLRSWASETNPKKLKTIIIGDDGTVYFTSNTNTPSLYGSPDRQDDLTRDEWDWWIEYTLTCQVSASQKTIAKNFPKVGFLYNDFSGKKTSLLLIENVQLFKKMEDAQGNIIYPGNLNSDSIIIQKYKYYNHSYCEREKITNADDITYLHDDVTKYIGTSPKLIPLYNEGNQKIRAISAKESNRFNILQTIAETFECWLEFKVDHDSTGKIIGDKRVNILKEIGDDVGYGFIYGIDLKSITRKIQSDQIVSKTIVKANSNEFAKNGFCTIARSVQNYPKAEFILDFGYYTSHGLLGQNQLNRDLYLTTGLAYFYKLRLLNTRLDEIAEMIPDLYLEQDQLNALITTHTNLILSAQEEVTAAKAEICQLAGTSSYTASKTQKYIKDNAKMPTIIENLAVINNATSVIKSSTAIKNAGTNRLTSIDDKIQLLEDEYQAKVDEKQALDNTFYQKYARFLQEGSWVSEDYIDDELYYLDARSVAYTSSRPKVSYTINVIRVSSLEEFKNKVFKIGDIGFVQDTEFFGYTTINGIQTPYKEKILISEITYNFEEPDKDTITVQNYKTQFDDLFQRITATTQSLQYASGEYALAAAQVQSGGGLTQEAIQTTLDLNTNLVYSALNQTITQDSTGITVADQTNRNNMTKITSGGVFITTDGGVTWKNAIRGDGVATQWLTAGSVNTNKITILDGTQPAFRWDSQGINAFDSDEEGVHLGTFVRFDKYGVYGIKDYNSGSENNNYIPANESAIWSDAAFGMTWDGFFMKNKRGSHRVEISSTDDIQVVATSSDEGEVAVVKIGLLEGNPTTPSVDDIYGIRLSDANGYPVLETGSDGNLWLKNILTVGDDSNASVTIGYDRDAFRENTDSHEVFNANNKFIVYEDGFFLASAGSIGNFVVDNGGLLYSDEETNKLLKFNPTEGLVLVNAPFSIGSNENTVLNFDPSEVNPTLTVMGNINATTLTVDSGEIGGFTINNDSLVSADGTLQLLGKLSKILVQNIVLGDNAKIQNYLQLGDRTFIYNPDSQANGKTRDVLSIKIAPTYLQWTDASGITFDPEYIYESINGEYFLTDDLEPVEEKTYYYTSDPIQDIINLKSTGIMTFGTENGIQINASDPNKPVIYCGSLETPAVSITPDVSTFNNIRISGKLITTVFEVNKTQIVGGSMVFKPSYKIVESDADNNSEDFYVRLEEELDTDTIQSYQNQYVYFLLSSGQLSDHTYKINSIPEAHKLTFTEDFIAEIGHPYGLVVLGSLDTNTAVAIGVNSGDSANQFLQARGITISELSQFKRWVGTEFDDGVEYYEYKENQYVITQDSTPITDKTYYIRKTAADALSRTRVFLGDLNTVTSQFTSFGTALTGYGLVGDNVFLQGSLTTIVPQAETAAHTYAGVNTISDVRATKFATDSSHIVFWGGAAGLTSADIQEAPFQVTELGSIYANQGVFEGAILSRSKIIGAKIYTAEIHGWTLEDNDSAPLVFYNVDKGLKFNSCTYSGDVPVNSETLFAIGQHGLQTNDEYFISIDDSAVNFIGTQFSTKNNLQLSSTILAIPSSVSLDFSQNQLTVAVEENTEFQVRPQQVAFGKNNLRYTMAVNNSTTIGYDLYVNEGNNNIDTMSTSDWHNGVIDIGVSDKPIVIGPGLGGGGGETA